LEEKKLLRSLIFPLFLFLFNALEVKNACVQNNTCPLQLQENFIQNSPQIVETTKQDKEFQTFLAKSLQQRDNVLDSKEFQDVVATLRASPLPAQKPLQDSTDKNTPAELTLFVSFSLGEKALLNLAYEAKIYGATLVLRGFKDNSYAQTVKALQKIIQETGQGFIIDPELFSLFSVTAVPTYVLSKPFQLQVQTQERTFTPLHDRLQGHVSLQYALETFAKEGDLKEEANSLLERARLEGGKSK
jgi:type-F conjugative transfer system pilin assembly protein TrbC